MDYWSMSSWVWLSQLKSWTKILGWNKICYQDVLGMVHCGLLECMCEALIYSWFLLLMRCMNGTWDCLWNACKWWFPFLSPFFGLLYITRETLICMYEVLIFSWILLFMKCTNEVWAYSYGAHEWFWFIDVMHMGFLFVHEMHMSDFGLLMQCIQNVQSETKDWANGNWPCADQCKQRGAGSSEGVNLGSSRVDPCVDPYTRGPRQNRVVKSDGENTQQWGSIYILNALACNVHMLDLGNINAVGNIWRRWVDDGFRLSFVQMASNLIFLWKASRDLILIECMTMILLRVNEREDDIAEDASGDVNISMYASLQDPLRICAMHMNGLTYLCNAYGDFGLLMQCKGNMNVWTMCQTGGYGPYADHPTKRRGCVYS